MHRTIGLLMLLAMLACCWPLCAQPPAAPAEPLSNGAYSPRPQAMQPASTPQGPVVAPGAAQLIQSRMQLQVPLMPNQQFEAAQGVTIRPNPHLAPPGLTPQEQADLDRTLKSWEEQGARIRTFSCLFRRSEFDAFNGGQKPRIDTGRIEFEQPDKGMFAVDGPQPERWVCNGKAIFQFDYVQKQITEHQLPPELQGKAIANGPLPFLFGSSAEELKRRYFLRVSTPPDAAREQAWITGFPRFQGDAANFSRAIIVLTLRNMQPLGLQLYPPGKPDGPDRTEYVFDRVTINPLLGRGLFTSDPFSVSKPDASWKYVVEPAPTAQVQRPGTQTVPR